MKKHLLVSLLGLLLLAGCGSNPPKPTVSPFIEKELKIFTYGDRRDDAQKKIRLIHGRELAEIIFTKPYFGSTEYIGDARDISSHKTTLRVSFLYTHEGADDGWPLDVSVHYILENDGKALFNKTFKVKATRFGAKGICPGCSPEETALTMLKNKMMPEFDLKIKESF
ncbi:hypothetical protein [Pleionea sp. CnH1-48]|uniref:hypothetical protein n=1 Tax=Pleionea sp. CnH1-48 TaxID=2954494 RepID=UPI002097C8F8|nr:hypothetical protein [Pleionea sp. CnH1-48]MCO7224177.1 hypothetical protein [Pleionea sp. CnH1-48]